MTSRFIVIGILGTFLCLSACRDGNSVLCEQEDLSFVMEERLRVNWVDQEPIDTFFVTSEIQIRDHVRFSAPEGWEDYRWIIIHPNGDTVRDISEQVFIDSLLIARFGNTVGYSVELSASKMCASGESLTSFAQQMLTIRNGSDASLLQNQFEGVNLSDSTNRFVITIEPETPPNISSGWKISGVPEACPYPYTEIDMGYRSVVVNGGELGIGNCKGLQGIGYLDEDNINFTFTYNYLPEGQTERIYDTFIGKRRWR